MNIKILVPVDPYTAEDLISFVELDYDGRFTKYHDGSEPAIISEYSRFRFSDNYHALLLSDTFRYSVNENGFTIKPNPNNCAGSTRCELVVIAPDLENGKRFSEMICLPDIVKNYRKRLRNNLIDYWHPGMGLVLEATKYERTQVNWERFAAAADSAEVYEIEL